MIVVRFKMQCQPGQTDQVIDVLRDVVRASRLLDGAISFDIGRDIVDPDALIATEVFDHRAALDRQEALPEVAAAMDVLGTSLAAAPEATIYHVSETEPWGE